MNYFKKKHLIVYNKSAYNYINPPIQGKFGIFFLNSGLLKFWQFKAIIFFLKKKLKLYSKIFLRVSNTLKTTKKSIGIRMGKGKGVIDEYYIPIKRGQIFLEFFFFNSRNFFKNMEFLRKIKRIIYLVSLKLNIKMCLGKF